MLFAVIADVAETVECARYLPRLAARRSVQIAIERAYEAVVVGPHVVQAAAIDEAAQKIGKL